MKELVSSLLMVLFLGIGVPAHADDTIFMLTLPTQGTPQETLGTLQRVVVAMGGHVNSDTNAQGLLTASFPEGNRSIMGTCTATTDGPCLPSLSCTSPPGGAEAFCRDVARRYKHYIRRHVLGFEIPVHGAQR